jgi:DNA polymerase-3 subunit beta
MKVVIKKTILGQALKALCRISPKKATLPVLNDVLVEADNGQLSLRATSLEVELSRSLPAFVDRVGAVCVDARQFERAVKMMGDPLVELEVESDQRLRLRSGQRSKMLLGRFKEEFPAQISVRGESFEVDSEALITAAGAVLHAVSKDDARASFTGAFLDQCLGGLRFVATDGHRLAMADLEASVPESIFRPTIIPALACHELKTSFSGLVAITSHEGLAIEFSQNGTSLRARGLEGRYPNYSCVLPKSFQVRAEADRKALLALLKRVKSDMPKLKKPKKGEKDNRGQLSGAVVEILDSELVVQTPGQDPYREALGAEVSAEPKSQRLFRIAPKYLIEAVQALRGDQVVFEAIDSESPTQLTSTDPSENVIQIVMPMRV